MRWIWWSIHQHKPRTMYLGPAPMLNQCRLSGSEFTLPPLFPLVQLGNMVKLSCQRFIHSQSFLNWLFEAADQWWLPWQKKKKTSLQENSADWVSVCLSHSCPLWPTPHPSMICARGSVTHGSFKKQRGEIFGRSWWESGDVGVRQGWRRVGGLVKVL